ncbi:beta strand repeat-containing protein [Rhodococcus sp. ACT016]|uniref:beta strand repeat-containing protein n=1 Tax=Rhodococcus sp. ACT016 TaxID=3134808 RepID=UPI003D2BC795
MAAGFAATVGVGSAGAASADVTWSDGNSKFTRTVSNSTPSVGDTITVSTKFERTGGVVEYIQAVKDLHPTCLTYTGGVSSPEIAADYTRVTGSWPVYPNISPKSQTFNFNYLVTASCARATPLMTTMHYSGSLGSGTYPDKGPTISVTKDATATTLAAVPTPMLTGQSVTLTATVTGAAQGNTVEFYDGGTKLGEGQINASGVGTFVWTPSTAGTRSLTAKFPGTAVANSSQSAAQNVQVNAPTNTTVALSVPGTALTGSPVTLTANVAPQNATGTVQFKDNGANIGSPVTVSNGQASMQHTFTTSGAHSITADYTAGSGFVNSSASAQTVTVNAATSTTLQAPASAMTGAPVTLSASVQPAGAVGTVQFKDNGTAIGSPVNVSNGQAALEHTFDAAGSHSITAEFIGGAGFASSTSAAQSVAVSDPDVTTSLAVSGPGSATTGTSVDLTATVSPSNAQGSVQFTDNGAPIGDPITVVNGVATLPHTFASAGSHSIGASFTGAAGFTSSTAAAQSVTVSDPDVETSLSLTVPGSATTGASVDLTATVSPSNAVGTVQFRDNGSNIGAPVTVANGEAVLPHTFTSAGSHSVTAEFTGAAGFTSSTAAAQSVSVADPDVETSLSVSAPGSATTGSSVDLSATVSPSNAQGSVQFKDNGSNIGAPVTVANGEAVLPHTFTGAGAHSITAEFTGAAGFTSSTAAAQSVTVTDPDVETSLSLTVPGSATTGSAVNLSATVSPSNAQGSVQFKDNGSNIGAPVTVANGEAVLPHTFTGAGAHSITAEFTGAAGFTSSTAAAQSVTVTDPDVVTSLTVQAPGSATTGSSVNLTATVSPSNAQGSVQFKDNGSNIGAPVTVANGEAVLPHTFTSAGSHSITAEFSAAAGFTNATAAAQSVTVTDPDVETSLTVQAPGSATTGSSVDLTAAVSPSNAQGSVQFKVNGAPVGAAVAVANGAASLPYTFDAAGTFSVTAEFTGAAGFTSSTSAAQSVTVTDPDVETSLSLTAPGSATTGSSVDLTAAVSPSNAQGSVQFKVNGNPVGAAVAVANGAASLPYTFNAAGTFSATAEFTGAAGFTSSTSAAQSVTVTDPDVVTSLTVQAPGSATTGSSVNLTATVSPSNAQGSVQFKDNGSNIGAPVTVANGEAVLPHTFTSAGSHSITAEFSAAAGFTNATAAAQSVTVTDPDVETSLTVQAPGSATTGSSVDLTAAVSPSNAQGSVQFKVNGAPVGAAVAVANGAASLPHTFDAAGTFSVTAEFTGAAGFTSSTAAAQSVTVTDPIQQTELSVTAPASAETGQQVNLSATVTPSNAQGSVQFKVNGNPVGTAVAVANGAASLPYTFNSAASYQVTAEFTGAAGFTNSSSTAQNVTVTDPVVPDTDTTTTVTAPASAETSQQVTLSASVSPVPSGGTIQFKVAGADVGAPVALDGNGHASLPYTFNAAGSFAVSAVYSGAPGFTGSTAPAQNVTVTDPAPVDVPTVTSLGAPATATTGVQTTLSATVEAQSGAAVPTGTVQFQDNGAAIGSPVALLNGSATLDHTFTTVGAHAITAVFTPGAGFVGSTSTPHTVAVSAPNPTDAQSSVAITSATAATAGTPFKLTATVTGAPTLPGTVQFFDGGIAIGQPVAVVNGIAELEHTFGQSGPHQIHAVYSGGTGVTGSTSPTQTLDVAESGGGTDGSGSLGSGSLGSLGGLRLGF